ncbi:MAG: pyruvate formate-lyase-activating protein [Maledivibacter sp.]|jgi:pyruvate formate lyase activating enzyme|nr:pyruvate formate-lyase-activating protein [Maledivibacter sp.]
MNITGRIHSVETCGTLDGPGLRYVVFFQGCSLRCQYCHNPDTWKIDEGKEVTIDNLIEDILKYRAFMKFSNGGVTASGGEPLLQHEFLKELFKRCKQENIHTAVDTSGCIKLDAVKEAVEYADLVLLDIKSYNTNKFKTITGASITPILEFINYLESIKKPTWIRHVLVPGLTDDLYEIDELAKFLATLKCVEKIEVLPFHKMGEYKWEQLGYGYKLRDTKPPTKEILKKVKEVFAKYKLNIS